MARDFKMRCDHLDGWVSEITAHETGLMIVVAHTPTSRVWRAMRPEITEAVELARRIVVEQKEKDRERAADPEATDGRDPGTSEQL